MVLHDACVLQLGQPDEQALTRCDVAEHLYEQVLDQLEGGDRPAELLSPPGVSQSDLVSAERAPDRLPRNPGAGHPQHVGSVAEARGLLEPVRLGYARSVE